MAERGDDDFGSPLLRDDTGPGATTSRKVFVGGLSVTAYLKLPIAYICVGLSAYQREPSRVVVLSLCDCAKGPILSAQDYPFWLDVYVELYKTSGHRNISAHTCCAQHARAPVAVAHLDTHLPPTHARSQTKFLCTDCCSYSAWWHRRQSPRRWTWILSLAGFSARAHMRDILPPRLRT